MMNGAHSIAAVVLAGGSSSRMGTSKALLPIGPHTALERVLESLAKAGVEQIVVVTGHEPERLAAVLERLGVLLAHNPRYETGMFSSVQAGVEALPADVGAFFVLPVDCALVSAGVLRRLTERYFEAVRGRSAETAGTGGPARPILYPTCAGRRGHPPLISGAYRQELLQADDKTDLRSLLGRHAESQVEVEVEDLSVLLDMDTPDDYRRLVRLSEHLDAADAPSTVGEPGDGRAPALAEALATGDARHLLALLEVPAAVLRHCEAVATVGAALVEAVNQGMPGAALDVELVRSAGLLHDMVKGTRSHAAVAQCLLENLGFRRLGEVVGSHMVLPEESLSSTSLTEAQLVYLADKLVVHDRAAGLEARTARALQRHGADPIASRIVEARIQAARVIAGRVEQASGRSLEAMLATGGASL
jgi:molybdenum cofactor cytidylyltransferase